MARYIARYLKLWWGPQESQGAQEIKPNTAAKRDILGLSFSIGVVSYDDT
jgi:hypothetical protein